MGANSKIEWCDHTFNPWIGCTKVSPACDNCYAETFVANRMGKPQLWQGERQRTSANNWKLPLTWDRQAERAGVRRKVFCASLADVFDNQVPYGWRDDLWHLIAHTPHLDWLLLTKRPKNILRMPPRMPRYPAWPWPNVWLGTTVENQDQLGHRLSHLLSVPATVHFLSVEPMLSRIRLPAADTWWFALDWVICGGESGPNARPLHPAWATDLRDQCRAAGIPFFFKQWGEHRPTVSDAGELSHERVGKSRAGAMLEGREWREFPVT